jgi:threonine dehydrogenase-like Zn-dependent dehydrogenase/predicted NBD/HSP70 family sugar kinase
MIVVDMGGTTTRIALFHHEHLLDVTRFATPEHPVAMPARQAQLDRIAAEVDRLRRAHPEQQTREVGVAVGATIDTDGCIRNASILWGEASAGFDLGAALRARLPWADLVLSNDIAAAAWRYQELGRFALVTVSTGLAIKIFDDDLPFAAKLIADADGLGGEIGHVRVGTGPDAGRHPSTEPAWCECGNRGDLCSYSSGPATVRAAVRQAGDFPAQWRASVLYSLCGGQPDRITSHLLADAARSGDAFTAPILDASTRPLAGVILQASALLGLRQFVVMGGFAHGIGKPWFDSLRANLRDLLPGGGWFTGWTGADADALVQPSAADDNDSLIGMGRFLTERRLQVRELRKPTGQTRAVVRRASRPGCGREQFAARIVYAGVCGTDLQILRGERGCEPGVLGHECVAEVVETGRDIRGLAPGQLITVNPNHPHDEHDKIGHNLPGIIRDVAIWDQHMIDRGQVIPLPGERSAEWVLAEPLACAVRSLRGGHDDWTGRRVLVIGAGVSGLLPVLLARRWQARQVLLANRGARRLRAASALGLLEDRDCVLLDADWRASLTAVTEGAPLDDVIVAVSGTAGPALVEQLWPFLADGAIVYLYGGFPPDATIRVPAAVQPVAVQPIRSRGERRAVDLPGGRSCTLIGSRGAGAGEFRAACDLLGAPVPGQPRFGTLISHIVSLDAAPAVLDELAATGCVDGDPALRVVVDLELRGRRIRRVQPAELAGAGAPR